MNEISVSFVRRIRIGTSRQKGGSKLSIVKRALAGLGTACLFLSMSCLVSGGLMTPCAAKGQMENVSPPFEVLDEVQGNQTVQVVKMVVKAKPEHVFRILTD